MPTPTNQRDFAVEVVRTLRTAGFESLWAGGCVRDQLLGLSPKDYDVATSARPEEVRNLFGKRRTLAIGASFGVISILGPKALDPIEVATFRADGKYLDGRHPESVSYTTAEQDAERRDFTINGLFFDPLDETVIDYVDGQQDLKARVLRAIGNPRARFSEDKLRMLRAARFAATFDFEIESVTKQAIAEMADQVTSVSAERIGMELRRMLIQRGRLRAFDLLLELGLLGHVLPELGDLSDQDLQATRDLLVGLSEPTLAVALAALLRIKGNPKLGSDVCKRLRFTNKEGERTVWLLQNVDHLEDAQQKPWHVVQRLLAHAGARELMQLFAASEGDNRAALEFCQEKLQLPAAELDPAPLLDGAALIAHGVKPGPNFAPLLEMVRNAQLDGEISDQQQALAKVDQWLASAKRQ